MSGIVTCLAIVCAGVALLVWAFSTPGDQLLVSFIGGMLIGVGGSSAFDEVSR